MKIHYHSECSFFAGCENMLVNFWSSPDLRKHHEISFSYKASDLYIEGLKKRVDCNFPVFPLFLPSPPDMLSLPKAFPSIIKKIFIAISRIIFLIPLLIYDICVLSRLFRKLKPDIIHINNGGYPASISARAAAIAAKNVGVPSVIMVVNNLAAEYKGLRWLDYPVDRLVVSSVDKFITSSIVATDRINEVLKLQESMLQTIHNGIKLRKTTTSKIGTRKRLGLEFFEGTIFGVIAILESRKGHQVLLKSIFQLRQKYLKNEIGSFMVIIEGIGYLSNKLKKIVKDKKLEPYCMFVGEEANIMDLLNIIDVLILPSINYEDFPNVILEAMGIGKAVIASRLAGTSEQVVAGKTGLLVEPSNVNELTESIIMLLNNPQIREEMGQAGQERFKKLFTEEKAVNKYLNLYKNLKLSNQSTN